MKRTCVQRLFAATIALTALGLSGTAAAQYIWLDERGVKQFSDMPPPASVPAGRILKQPGGGTSTSTASAPATAAATAPSPAKTASELNAEFRKRQLAQAEKEKKAVEENRMAADKAKNCERAHEYNRVLESGERISRTDKNGERSFLTDEQRAQELRDTRRLLEDCK